MRQLAATLKSMNAIISDSEMIMALRNGLLEDHNAIRSAQNSVDIHHAKIKFEFIESTSS